MFSVYDGLEMVGISFNQPTPYQRAAKKTVANFMTKPWLQGWMWAVSIEKADAPEDFDIYVKDVNFGAGSIDVDMIKVANGHIAVPASSSAGEITLTVRDDQALTMDKWFDSRLAKVKNKNGTLNVPANYVFKIKFFTLNENGVKSPYREYYVYPVKKGDITLSRENGNTIHSFPIIFQKFSSVGGKVFK